MRHEQAGADGVSLRLPPARRDGKAPLERLLSGRRSIREFARSALTLAEVGQILWAAQGVTHPAGLRAAPSAGALYPLETYLLVGEVSGLAAGVYHYQPHEHGLAKASEGDRRAGLARAALGQMWVADAPAVLVLAAVYRRTAGRYGARAERYVHIEVGHAAQNVYLQALALGLGTTEVGAFDDRAVQSVLGLAGDPDPLAIMPLGRLA
jgi:SagB-type dehydrogenase family enzyme